MQLCASRRSMHADRRIHAGCRLSWTCVAPVCPHDMLLINAGVLSGCGRQTWCACANLACFWALGLPLSWLLGLRLGFGLDGLWGGIAVASLAQVRHSVP